MARVYHSGTVRTILITEDGDTSIRQMVEVHRAQVTKELARANALIKQLGETGQLVSPEQFRQEGDSFWAIRAGTVRVYGWYEPGGIFVISHVISKRAEKLSSADKKRMKDNRAAFHLPKGRQ